MNYLGNHLLIEMYDCNRQTINDVAKIEKTLLEAVKISKATALTQSFHKFSPHGVSGVVVISESHFSIHTWPEYGYCALDIFTCGTQVDTKLIFDYISSEFHAQDSSIKEVDRGILNLPSGELRHKPIDSPHLPN